MAPTEHVGAAIRNLVSVPVRHYPMAANVENIVPADRAAFGIPKGSFAFVTTFDTDSGLNRKNGLGVLRAFSNAFRDRSDVVLVLKVNGIAQPPELAREIASMKPGSIIVIDKYLSYAEVLGLYAACDAFVSLHRAEGLGLGPMEAMLLGKPVIATGWSGNMDFMNDAGSALVRFNFVPVLDTQLAYQPGFFARPQLWAEPDLLHASALMVRFVQDEPYRTRIAATGLDQAKRRRDAFYGGLAAETIGAIYGASSRAMQGIPV
jgi:hypothetical protein